MKRKTVIGLGDSILLQSSPYLFECFSEHDVTYLSTDKGLELDGLDRNVGPSTALKTYIEAIEKMNIHADVLIMACGLHDIKHVCDMKSPMVSIETFENTLEDVFVQARLIALKTVWILMPPVSDGHHNSRLEHKRYDLERKAYNDIVSDVSGRHGVTLIDSEDILGSFDEKSLVDHIHLDPEHVNRYAEGVCLKIMDRFARDFVS